MQQDYKHHRVKKIPTIVKNKLLGKGNHSEVWLMSNLKNHCVFVRKYAVTDDGVLLLQHEHSILTKLSGNKKIIKCIGCDKHYKYIDLEYIHDVADLYKLKRHLSFEERLMITMEILGAIKKMHDMGITHRDIKLDNIVYSRETGKLAIIDFGCAVDISNDDYLTKHHLKYFGTVMFNPPEIINMASRSFSSDKKLDMKKIDVWQTGCLIYELFTGQQPFQGDVRIENTQLDKKLIGNIMSYNWNVTDIPKIILRYQIHCVFELVFRPVETRCSISDIFNLMKTISWNILFYHK